MYSINVFLTFSLSMIGMCRHWWQLRNREPDLAAAAGAVSRRRGDVHFRFSASRSSEKFDEGGWVTLAVTALPAGSASRSTTTIAASWPGCSGWTKRLLSVGHAQATAENSRTRPQPCPRPRSWSAATTGLGRTHSVECRALCAGAFQEPGFSVRGGRRFGAISKGPTRSKICNATPKPSLNKYVDLAHPLGHARHQSYMAIGTDAGRRAGASLPDDRQAISEGDRSSPANSSSRKTPGSSGCCTTRRPIRCSAAAMGRPADGDSADAGEIGRRRQSAAI